MNWLGIVAFRNQGINEAQGVAFEGKVEFDCRVVTPQPCNYPPVDIGCSETADNRLNRGL